MNDMKKAEAVEEALDRLYERLEELNGMEGKISDSCVELYRMLLHGIKSGETVITMKGGEDPGYSRRGGAYYDDSSYARKRNRMGRFSRDSGGSYEDGYSRHETGSLKKKLQELMEDSPEEYRKLMDQLDG
jgi:hypothetical protein